ncbi:MAG: cobalt-precorrin-6y C5-methyltransferase / Cobalt-precorrin-6y C15-methyltransferase [Osedax symbiont Rs2]|nr:MAG: cobalt-precorrin-6y C5-methyltransferase / Cobalt-precorrin-6y C15-methyltransferase [Osedax symbiont Rs2]
MQEIKISIIGLGACEAAQLSDGAMSTLLGAEMILGSKRQLKVVSHLLKEHQITPLLPKLDVLETVLQQYYNQGVRSVVVLASGDPLYYGIGSWFSRTFTPEKIAFYPAVSSVQEVCHRLGLSLQNIDVLSLHGRPVGKLRSKLRDQQTLLILTDAQSTPQILANELIEAGFYEAKITVCEAIGYRYEQISSYPVKALLRNPKSFDPLHITVIDSGCSVKPLPQFPGFANHHFITDGEAGRNMITKAEVRLKVLSLLEPRAGDIIYDIGAGCGSVSIELNYWCAEAKVFAIEKNQQRYDCLKQNQKKFGLVTNLHAVHGSAPGILAKLPVPNKIFIGGSDGMLPQLLERLWSQLAVGGQIVATAVLENTKHDLIGFLNTRNVRGDAKVMTQQIAISHGDTLGGQLVYRQALPVSIFNFVKRSEEPVIKLRDPQEVDK